MSQSLTENAQPTLSELACCIDCGTPLQGHDRCPGCKRVYATRDDIAEAIGPLRGRNRIVAAFYDGLGWARFRKWERLFLTLQGGARRARMSILRHLSGLNGSEARVLEVGIGDGENLQFLPSSWAVYGVDIARTQLVACRDRFPQTRGRVAWAEAERLPFPDATFDACYSIGGFTYFEDHAEALGEMRRVTRAGGPVVVADENPGMHKAGIGHLIGRPLTGSGCVSSGSTQSSSTWSCSTTSISAHLPARSGPMRREFRSGTAWATVSFIRPRPFLNRDEFFLDEDFS